MGCHNIHPNDLLEVILFSIIIAFYSLFRSKKGRYLSLLFYSKYILKVSIAHLTTLIMSIAELLSIHFWSSHYSAKHYFRSLNSGFLHCSPYSPKSTIFFSLSPALCPIFLCSISFSTLVRRNPATKPPTWAVNAIGIEVKAPIIASIPCSRHRQFLIESKQKYV